MVVPSKHYLCRRKLYRFITEFNVADPPPEAGMAANLDQQSLAVACCLRAAARFDSHVVPQCAVQENIVPAADMQGRDANIREMLVDGPLLPIGVVVGMR